MNLFFATAQVISQPRLIELNGKYFYIILASITNNKNIPSFYTIRLICNRLLFIKYMHLYRIKDFIFIEGYIDIKALYIKNEYNSCSILRLKHSEVKVSQIDFYFNY